MGNGIEVQQDKFYDLYDELFKLGYLIHDADEVIPFILNNYFLKSVLKEMPNKVLQYFKNSSLQLSVYYDIEENFKLLIITVMTNLTPEEAAQAEFDFFDNYFAEPYLQADGKICLSIRIK